MCAGVLPFAKKGDDRNNNLVRLQQMFPRIVAADFEHPKHVSAQGRHLLSRMLTSDPASRITIAEVLPSTRHCCMHERLPALATMLQKWQDFLQHSSSAY